MAKPKLKNVSKKERSKLDKDNKRKKLDYVKHREARIAYQREYRKRMKEGVN